MKKIIIILLFSIIFIGACKSNEPVVLKQYIRDTIITIKPPVIRDTGIVQIITDTLIEYFKVEHKDTVIKVKYFPKERLITVYAQPKDTTIIMHDTTFVIETKEIRNDNNVETILLAIFGIAVVLSILFIIMRAKN